MDDTVALGKAISMDDTVTPEEFISNDRMMAVTQISTGAGAGVSQALAAMEELAGKSASGDLDELPTIDPKLYVRGAEIARGGMGRILQVRDRKLGRDLAIKELLSRTPALEKRFYREMKITARLQHPAIISVHDAGRWPSGEAFYTMKHVEGEALDRVIAGKERLQERLALLPTVIAVADALAYAHSRNVIHRDLKPANVLVGDYGETVVIDWGLAKDLRRAGDDDTFDGSERSGDRGLTVLGEALGTPAYMPPEQARGETVDERADVYSLGALLYHLLAGRMPYEDAESSAALRCLDLVKDGPPTPLADLGSGTPRELLAIVDKAMAREPGDRYRSAGALAEDLRRYQTGQLVGAHDYSSWQLLARWIGRHRAAVAVAAVMVAVLAVGAALSFSRVARARDRAEENRAEVEQLLDFMLSDLRDKLQAVGKLELLDMVARRASDYFARRPVDWSRPEEASRRAIAHDNLGVVLRVQGDLVGALAESRASQEIRERLVDIDADNAEWKRDLASSHNRIGSVLEAQGDYSGALAEFRVGKALCEQLVAMEPENPAWRSELAASHDNVGGVLGLQADLAGALAEYRLGQEIRERLVAMAPDNEVWQRGLSLSYGHVGGVLMEQDDLVGALAQRRAGKEIAEQMLTREPDNADRQYDLMVSHIIVGDVLQLQGDLAGALVEFRAGKALAARLVDKSPDNTSWRSDFSLTHDRVGDVLRSQGDLAGALIEYRASKVIVQGLVAMDPDNAVWQRNLAVSHDSIGTVLRAGGDLAGALVEYRAGLVIRQRLIELDPDNAIWQRILAVSHIKVGDVLREQGELTGALAEHLAGQVIAQRLVEKEPDSARWQRDLAVSCLHVGGTLQRLGQDQAAREQLARGAALYEAVAMGGLDFYNTACTYAMSGDPDKAFAMLAKAIDRGYRDVAWAGKDTDLVSLHDDPRWQQVIDQMTVKK